MYAQDSVDPIIMRLRPRSLGELLDQGFRLYRRHFLTFLAMTAVVFIPVSLAVQFIEIFLGGSASALGGDSFAPVSRTNEALINQLLTSGTSGLLGLLANWLQYLSQAALTSSVHNSIMDRPVSFAAGYRAMWQRIGPISGAIGLQVLLAIALFLPLYLLIFLASFAAVGGGSSSGGALGLVCVTLLALIPVVVFAIYIYVRWSLVVPAIMVEDCGPREGLRRSAQLVQGYWWRTVGLILLLSLLGLVIAGGPATVVTLLLLALFKGIDALTLLIVVSVVSVFITTIIVPLNLTTTTLYYFDLRVRKEGFDLETAIGQRYLPQYGQYGQYGGPGGPPLGWETGREQYAPPGQGQPGGAPGMVPPTLGQANAQRYGNVYRYSPQAAPATQQAIGTEPLASEESDSQERGAPAVAIERETQPEPATLNLEPGSSNSESVDMGQRTSPTPGWLAPPVLGARDDGEKGAGTGEVDEGEDREQTAR